MKAWTAALLILALAGSAAHAAPLPAAPAKQPAAAIQPEPRQVLVLLRLPPEHFRAQGDYGAGYGDGASQAARRRVVTRIARAHGLMVADSWPMPLLQADCFILDVPPGRSLDEMAADLAREPEVTLSQPVHRYVGEAVAAVSHNDPLFPIQPAARVWRLAELHALATGRSVRVAVIDSGVDVRHPDLTGQILTRQDFAPRHPGGAEDHGTGVAGVIAGVADNRLGIAGVAPGARILALRACWQAGSSGAACDTLSLAKALHYAVDHGAQVVNMSLSGPPDPLLGRLIDLALARGAAVVGAADPSAPGGGFPASHPGVVAVSDNAERAAAIGAYLAPGRDVPTTEPQGRWGLVNGSSFAAAHVAGLLALMRERDPKAAGLRIALADPGARAGPIDACASLSGARGCPPPRGYAALGAP